MIFSLLKNRSKTPIYLTLFGYISTLSMAWQKQLQRAAIMPRNQAQLRPLVPLTKSLTKGNATLSKAGLSSSLTCSSSAPTNDPEPIPASGAIASTEKLLKLFMQIYIDTVKNQV